MQCFFTRKYELKSYFFPFILLIKITNLLCLQLCDSVILQITFIWRELCLRFFLFRSLFLFHVKNGKLFTISLQLNFLDIIK